MANYRYIESTGVVVPDTAGLLDETGEDFRAVFGNDMPVDPETPQGVLIAGETSSRRAIAELTAAQANQINPDIASGGALDSICALTGLSRDGATFSTVASVTLTGVSGTIIPAGRRAKTTAGDEFQTASAVTIGPGGSASVDFVAVESGPVPAAVGALNSIVDFVLGWETVSNTNSAVLGSLEQSDASLRQLRKNTLALQGSSLPEAIVSALYATEGVQSLQFRENYTNTPQTIDGIYLLEHSIWACVNGGTDVDIAAAILGKKSGGCNFNGAELVNVVEPSSGQSYPVRFDRPAQVPIQCRLTLRAGSFTGDIQQSAKNAVVAFADGEIDGETGFVVGGSVSPFEIGAAVNFSLPGIYVQKVEVAYVSDGIYITTELPIEIDEIATITAASVTVIEV